MGDAFDSLISQRVGAYASTVDDSDWLDVERRAAERAPSARRRFRVVAIAAALVAGLGVLAAPGWGVGYDVVDLFTGDPAPAEVQQAVHGADVGAPEGMAPGIDASKTRKLLAIPLADGRQATLWVAPTRSGDLCVYVQRGSLAGGPGCGPSAPPVDQVKWGFQGRGEYDDTFLLHGRVPNGTSSLALRFEDGATADISLVKGFFLYQIPSNHLARGARPSAFTAYDSSGNEIAQTDFPAFVERAFEQAMP